MKKNLIVGLVLSLSLLGSEAFARIYPICKTSRYQVVVNALDDHPVGIVEISRFDARRKAWTTFGDELGYLQIDSTGRATVYGKRISQFVPVSAVSDTGNYRAKLHFFNGSKDETAALVCKAASRR